MKPSILSALGLTALLAVTLVPCATADGPQRDKGKVLILKNDRTLAGDIVRAQGGYTVRRATGELWLPATEVKCLCADWEEALDRMRTQFNLHDPDELLKLAKWCEHSGLYPQAIELTQRALDMRPKHAGSQHYLTYLDHVVKSMERKPEPAQNKKDMAPAPAVDLSADSLSQFVTKVQPILMNTCVQCHVNGEGGGFQLMRVSGIGATWQRATQVNMAAVVRHINTDNAVLSPLLIKSIAQHGGATKAPLPGRESPPYQLLKYWVETTIATNPHLRQDIKLAGSQQDSTGPALFATQGNAKAPVPVLPPLPTPGLLPANLKLGPDIEPQGAVATPAPKSPHEALPTVPLKSGVMPAAVTPVPGPGPAPAHPSSPPTGQSDPYDKNVFNNMFHQPRK
jgi:hypothetical protein